MLCSVDSHCHVALTLTVNKTSLIAAHLKAGVILVVTVYSVTTTTTVYSVRYSGSVVLGIVYSLVAM